MEIIRLPRPPGTSPGGSRVGGRRVPLRYGGSGRPPSQPGRRSEGEADLERAPKVSGAGAMPGGGRRRAERAWILDRRERRAQPGVGAGPCEFVSRRVRSAGRRKGSPQRPRSTTDPRAEGVIERAPKVSGAGAMPGGGRRRAERAWILDRRERRAQPRVEAARLAGAGRGRRSGAPRAENSPARVRRPLTTGPRGSFKGA